jgi:hypothetical protein
MQTSLAPCSNQEQETIVQVGLYLSARLPKDLAGQSQLVGRFHVKKASLIPLLLFLAACDVSTGGAGLSQRGTPFTGEITTDVQNGGANLVLMSPSGLRCDGFLKNHTGTNAISTRQVPLKCNDGQTGQAILALDRIGGKATASFQLSRGEAGNIVFGG